MSEPFWLTRRAEIILDEQLAEHGDAPGLHDEGLLESALAPPCNPFAYEGPGDLRDLAAACAAGMVRNHPFVDGNKRTGFLAAYTFLLANGLELVAPEAEALGMTLDLASGELPEAGHAAWLRDRTDAA